VIGKYVRNIHAKDGFYPTCGSRLGEEVPIGTGKVDFPALFRRLHELNYHGPVTIEREIEGDQQIRDILDSRQYLQNIIDKAYGGTV
jgi:sugar phosphate isomerase/epimerase